MRRPNAKQRRTLSQLQRLQTIFEHATAIAEERDPNRQRDDGLAGDCDAIATLARDAFFSMTWRFPFAPDVQATDLNTENPAAWIRDALNADGTIDKPKSARDARLVKDPNR